MTLADDAEQLDRDDADVAVLTAIEILTDDHIRRDLVDRGHPHGLTRATIRRATAALERADRLLADHEDDPSDGEPLAGQFTAFIGSPT